VKSKDNPSVRFHIDAQGRIDYAYCLACGWKEKHPDFSVRQDRVLTGRFKKEAYEHPCRLGQ